jgi:hypothetical protein
MLLKARINEDNRTVIAIMTNATPNRLIQPNAGISVATSDNIHGALRSIRLLAIPIQVLKSGK